MVIDESKMRVHLTWVSSDAGQRQRGQGLRKQGSFALTKDTLSSFVVTSTSDRDNVGNAVSRIDQPTRRSRCPYQNNKAHESLLKAQTPADACS